jgi:hypothetical protein
MQDAAGNYRSHWLELIEARIDGKLNYIGIAVGRQLN